MVHVPLVLVPTKLVLTMRVRNVLPAHNPILIIARVRRALREPRRRILQRVRHVRAELIRLLAQPRARRVLRERMRIQVTLLVQHVR